MRKPIRYLTALTAFAALAIALSGCVIIKSNSSAQLDGIGSVQITTTFCASDGDSNNPGYSPPDPSCQGPGTGGNANANAANAGAGTLQLLLAYRIPDDATAPESFDATSPAGATFTRSASYGAELQSLSPAPSGEQWVGYASNAQSYNQSGNQYFSVAPRFGLQHGPKGEPFEGPFSYRVTVGYRRADGSNPVTRPVDCGPVLTDVHNDGPGDMICIDSPTPAALASSLQQPTQDLGILDAPGAESVKQGRAARVKFQLDYAGDGNPAPTFLLDASTNVPGATAVPSTPLLTPEEGTSQVRVVVRPPIGTDTGSYDVTLTASVPGGETRSSTHEILVTPTTVRCTAIAPTIAGTVGDDRLVGTPGRDVIAGYRGNDDIVGLGGNDKICAGKGDDRVRGGNGNDRIAGRRGNDRLAGGRGHNLIRPGPGKDRFVQ